METELNTLNAQFAIPGHVSFHSGPGGLAMAVINNAHASGTMTLAGGHVMTFTPHGAGPLLWVSPLASYTLGRAMRGGVPICWPWFATHPSDPENMPMHGLVRTMLWTMSAARALPGGETELRMTVSDTPETLALWPHPFTLEVIATFGRKLRVEWVARNPGSSPYQYTGALHPYFNTANVRDITIRGLEGVEYLDKNDAFRQKTQPGPLRIQGPIDAIFLDTAGDVSVEDPGLGRKLRITKTGSHTTVVWNPDQRDAELPDVGAGQHAVFFCVESANAAGDVVHVPPGGEGRLGMEMGLE